MAKFTSTAALNIHWHGNEISGAAGATHRIPDALQDEFDAAFSGRIPGLTWVSQDESTAYLQSPITEADVTNLTSDIAGKYDKTGGTISGAVTVTGTLVAQDSATVQGAATILGAANLSSTLGVSGLATLGSLIASAVTATAARFNGSPWYDVRAYGAAGDGTTDDTTAFQNAIAAVGSDGGVVYVPAGTYKITSSLAFGLHASLRGEGSNQTILVTAQTSGYGISWTGATTTPETGWATRFNIEGVWISHSGSSAALALNQCIYVRVNDVKVSGNGATGHGIEVSNSYDITFNNCHASTFTGNKAWHFISNGVTQPGQWVLSNCTGRYSAVGCEIQTTSGIIDGISLDSFICTDNTSVGLNFEASGAGTISLVHSRNLHIEQSDKSNSATGIRFNGSNFIACQFDNAIIWTQKKVIDASTATAFGLSFNNLYVNANSHASQGTALTFGSGVTALELGYVLNSSIDPYTTLISDSSDTDSRRKTFAGAKTIVQAASSSLTLTQTAQDVPGVTKTATPTVPEVWEVTAVIDFNVTSAGTGLLIGQIVFDTTTASQAAHFDGTSATGRLTAAATAVFAASAGTSHTVKVQAWKVNAGGTVTAVSQHTTMMLRRSGIGA